MKITVELPDYDGTALDVIWEDSASYNLKICENEIVISANKSGLISLAKQMLYLACNDLPMGSHVHYDEFFTKLNALKYELVIEKNME